MRMQFKDLVDEFRIDIYDNIGSYEDEINTKEIQEKLENANGKPLAIHINSGGGEVFEGFAIYNLLKGYEGQKTTYIDGLAGSIASVIALSGDKVIMNQASMFMIHNAWGGCFGNAEEMRQVANALEQVNEVIKAIYVKKTNLSKEELTELMDKESFITPEDCLKYGFCDEVIDGQAVDKEPSLNNLLDSINKKLETMNKLKELPKAETPKEEPKKNKTKAFMAHFLREEI